MHSKSRGALLVAASIMFGAFTAKASATVDFMPTGSITSQPVGHYEFCQQMPSECSATYSANGPVHLSRELWAKMIEINNKINSTIVPRTDMELWGREELWSYPELYGDCEDYVLEKRRLLMEAGVPAGNLLITVVRQPNGDGHAVLTVNTHLGDFILDNLEPRILSWSQTPYEYLKRQASDHAGAWVTVHDGRAVAVGAVGSNR